MPLYSYTALDSKGKEKEGTLEGANQNEAITRLKEMGFFPTKVIEVKGGAGKEARGVATGGKKKKSAKDIQIRIPGLGGVNTKTLCTFTRQLATLVDAGLPLLRGMQVLAKQEKNPDLRDTILKLAATVEGGSTFSEALAQHPKLFDKLFINMVKAGELGGVLEVTLNRLSEFMEKAEKIKSKVKAAMFYPVAVLVVATGIVILLMIVVVPSFEKIFADMFDDKTPLPDFTLLVLNISRTIQNHFLLVAAGFIALWIAFKLIINKTKAGRYWFDWALLRAPAVGSLITKVAISRFTRTLGTLIASGVPILQALNIVRETAGNVIIANAIIAVYESVKEGESITRPLEASGVFPPMVVSMVDVGEQTGAMPEMLIRIANNYDEEVDTAVGALTSLIEPIMIVFLAVVVGSIVIAMFMPLIAMMDKLGTDG